VRKSSVFVGLAAALLLLAEPAHAHLGNLSYSDIAARGDEVAYRLKFAAHLIPGLPPEQKLLRQQVMGLEPQLIEWLSEGIKVSVPAGPCRPSLADTMGPDNNDDLTVELSYKCAGPTDALRVAFHPFDGPLPEYRNIVTVRRGKETLSFVFAMGTPILIAGDASLFGADAAKEAEASQSRFGEFFRLGVEHIWTGYDHLLFLLALFLPGGTIGRIAGIVTAFTIAHSITLALAALDIVRLPIAPIEIAIAASIIYAAASALRKHDVDRRWLLTFFFGLIHGFGFASVLRESGLPPGGAAVPLFAFNAGVEAGQLAVVVVAVPLLRLATAGTRGPAVRRVLAWAVIAMGVFWTTERAAAWVGL